jgi:hypothetical protein
MRLGYFLMAAFLATTVAAHAFTGTELNTACSDDRSAPCASYMQGLVDGLTVANASAAGGPKFCTPVNLSVEQVTSVVQRIFRENPKMLTEDSSMIAATALWLAFPCPN